MVPQGHCLGRVPQGYASTWRRWEDKLTPRQQVRNSVHAPAVVAAQRSNYTCGLLHMPAHFWSSGDHGHHGDLEVVENIEFWRLWTVLCGLPQAAVQLRTVVRGTVSESEFRQKAHKY